VDPILSLVVCFQNFLVDIISHLLRVFCIFNSFECFVKSSEQEALNVWIQNICESA
jgi:hypothetical protein